MKARMSFADKMLRASRLINDVCTIAHPTSELLNGSRSLQREGILRAIRRHDSPAIFDWLMHVCSLQGISDQAALTYITIHGNARHADIERDFVHARCPKLQGFWSFAGCNYKKVHQTCANRSQFGRCPLPKYRLRNGHLNKMAFALFLFIRDVAGGDLVGWLDHQVGLVDDPENQTSIETYLIAPLKSVYGISDKVATMALSSLFLGSHAVRPKWAEIGAHMIVVDSLVHNFMVRTGMLRDFGRGHAYGPACYQPGGCAGLLLELAEHVDTGRFSASFPQPFPRFVQSAIWRYCATGAFDVCNGVRIDDRRRCRNRDCLVRSGCGRLPLSG